MIGTLDVGTTPVDTDWSIIGFGTYRLAMIANQGGLNDPDGSISMYINGPPVIGSGFFTPNFAGAALTRNAIEATFTEGIKNPVAIWGNQQWMNRAGNSVPIEWWVANTGGETVINLQTATTGVFGVTISPQATGTFNVGPNPRHVVRDPFHPNAFVFASVTGIGGLAYASTRHGASPPRASGSRASRASTPASRTDLVTAKAAASAGAAAPCTRRRDKFVTRPRLTVPPPVGILGCATAGDRRQRKRRMWATCVVP